MVGFVNRQPVADEYGWRKGIKCCVWSGEEIKGATHDFLITLLITLKERRG